MPLSEHEQRMLAEMENALASEDPRFASHMRGSSAGTLRRKRLIIGGIGVLAGLGLILLGIQTTMWVGAAGFAVMVAAAAYALAPAPSGAARGSSGKSGNRKSGKKSASRRGGGFLDRLDERWERRQHDQ